MENFTYIRDNYLSLKEEIRSLSLRLGIAEPTLVSVTKSGSDEELIELVRAGANEIGENRPGELARRYELLRNAGLFPKMHEIGTLQRNKIKLIAPSVHMIHSIDSLRLATDVDRHARVLGRTIPVLVEVNSAKEEQKSGVFPEDAEKLIYDIQSLTAIKVVGIMTMGPFTLDGEVLRPYFRNTRKLFDRLSKAYGFGSSATLSMGMSDSWRVAIEEGSTLVRVGRRLFTKQRSL